MRLRRQGAMPPPGQAMMNEITEGSVLSRSRNVITGGGGNRKSVYTSSDHLSKGKCLYRPALLVGTACGSHHHQSWDPCPLYVR